MKKILKILAIVFSVFLTFGLLGRITNAHLFERKKKADTETEQEHELQWVAVQQLEVGKKYKWKDNISINNNMTGKKIISAIISNDEGDTFESFELQQSIIPKYDCIKICNASTYNYVLIWENVREYYQDNGVEHQPGVHFYYNYIELKSIPTESDLVNYLTTNLLEQA